MVMGTSTKPRSSTFFAHSAMRAIVDRQRVGEPDRGSMFARRQFQSRQRAVDLDRCRHGIDHDVGFGEREVMAAGELAGDAARRSAVVYIDQPALGGLAHHRCQRWFGRGEAGAHVAHDPDIALEAAHLPMQPVDVLVGGERGQQRLRSRVVVGIVERLHRGLQQHFVIGRLRALRQRVEIRAVGCDGQRHGCRQFRQCIGGAGRADAEPAYDNGDARRIGLVRRHLARMCEDHERTRAVHRDLRDGAVAGGFQNPRVACRLGRKVARFARNNYILMLAARAIDNGDGPGSRWQCDNGWRGHLLGGSCACCRSVVASVLLAVAIRFCGYFGERPRGDHSGGLATQGVVDKNRPGHQPRFRTAQACPPEFADRRPGASAAPSVCSGRGGRSDHPMTRPKSWRIIRGV